PCSQTGDSYASPGVIGPHVAFGENDPANGIGAVHFPPTPYFVRYQKDRRLLPELRGQRGSEQRARMLAIMVSATRRRRTPVCTVFSILTTVVVWAIVTTDCLMKPHDWSGLAHASLILFAVLVGSLINVM